jgi:cell division protein FtsL
MLQLTQIKLLSLIAALLLSILGIVTYEHHQAEVERRRVEAERQAKEKFWKDLQREEQDPRNREMFQKFFSSETLRKH